MRRVLLDGWALAHEPAGPAALHTWALLAWRPAEIELILALPGERPGWLPGEVQFTLHSTKNAPWERLAWEQQRLPQLAKAVKADVLHTSGQFAPFASRLACTNSPASFPEPRRKPGMAERLRQAAGEGGMNAIQARLWPADLPVVEPRSVNCPPFVHPAFTTPAAPGDSLPLELPETFVLYHGPVDETSLRRLLAAWSWAAGPIGGYYPLLLPGLEGYAKDVVTRLIKEYQTEGSVQVLPIVPTPAMPALYQRCSALFHPAEVIPWGDPVLHALACGRPIAAASTPLTSARTGPAAYLAPLDDPRALGAALITLVVEEGMAENLAQAARQRLNTWDEAGIHAALSALWNS